MFCKHCGTSLPDNTKFCPKCGKAISDSSASPTITNTQEEPLWESKTLSVNCGTEEPIIEIHEGFGWELVSTQDVKTKDTHLEQGLGGIWSVTEKEEYVKLFFRRNKNRKNYTKLAELEAKYYANDIDRPLPSKAPYTFIRIFGVILLSIGILSALSSIGYISTNPVMIVMLIPGVLMLIGGIAMFKNSKTMESNNEDDRNAIVSATVEGFDARIKILDEAKKYL